MRTIFVLLLSIVGMLVGLEARLDFVVLVAWAGLAIQLFLEFLRYKSLVNRISVLSCANRETSQTDHMKLDALSYRLQLAFPVADPEDDADIDQLLRMFLKDKGDRKSLEPLFQAVLNHLRSTMCGRLAAIAIESVDQLLPYDVYLNGLRGRDTVAILERLARETFMSRSSSVATEETFKKEHRLGLVCAHQFQVHLQGSSRRALIWLGYDSGSMPLARVGTRVRKIADRLSAELGARSELAILGDKVMEAEQLITHMSHDIRSPLNNIKAILSLFKAENLGTENQKLVDVALANCGSAAEIVEDLIDYSRHRAGSLQTRAEEFDLTQLTKEVVVTFSSAAEQKGLGLHVESSNLQLIVKLDKRQLRRILANLIGNAVKYTNYGAVSVVLKVGCAGAVNLSVSDTGVGMSQDQLTKLFTPFTRFHGPETDGIGLGLALTKILAELNQLTVNVKSRPNSGSTFKIEGISLVDSPRGKNENQSVLKLTDQILLVDDDPDCALTLAKHLRLSGFDTLTAFSVSEAENLLSFGLVPTALITDSAMPCGGGEALVRIIRQRGLSVPIFVLSGSSSPAELGRLRDLGVNKILEKPVSPAELIAELTSDSLHLAA